MQKRTRGFIKIDKIITCHDKLKKADEQYWKYKAIKHWNEAVGGFFEEAREQTLAVDLKNGVLVVASLSRELSRKLKLLAEKIIQALNELLGRRVVYGLVLED